MCQLLCCCECIYLNECFSCEGCSVGLLCCGCWMCPAPAMTHLRGPDCCKVGCNQGCGASCFCFSEYWCIPNWLQDYSNWHSIKERRTNGRETLYDMRIHPVAIAERDYGNPQSNRQFN